MSVLLRQTQHRNLYYDFEINDHGKIKNYGTYDKNSYVCGIVTQDKNCTVHFNYKGTESISFAIIPQNYNKFDSEFDFPITSIDTSLLYRYDSDPILYNVGKQFHYAIFIEIGIFICLYLVMYIFCCDKECCMCIFCEKL